MIVLQTILSMEVFVFESLRFLQGYESLGNNRGEIMSSMIFCFCNQVFQSPVFF